MTKMQTSNGSTPVRILIINPNTSKHMTDALVPVVDSLDLAPVQYTYYTSPSEPTGDTRGIPSINSPEDAKLSADHSLPSLLPLLAHHDAFLVACYSAHPLVPALKHECAMLSSAATSGSHGSGARKYVTGIFEASVTTSLLLTPESDSFGIVSTGKIWEMALQTAVDSFLGQENSSRFMGCETTGLNASELHDLPPEAVRERMMQATKRLLRKGQEKGKKPVGAICLGCAGMVGLDDAVRDACIDELGEDRGKYIHIVDGVKAGVGMLFGMARAGF